MLLERKWKGLSERLKEADIDINKYPTDHARIDHILNKSFARDDFDIWLDHNSGRRIIEFQKTIELIDLGFSEEQAKELAEIYYYQVCAEKRYKEKIKKYNAKSITEKGTIYWFNPSGVGDFYKESFSFEEIEKIRAFLKYDLKIKELNEADRKYSGYGRLAGYARALKIDERGDVVDADFSENIIDIEVPGLGFTLRGWIDLI